ncbi:WD40-repeat-containing domain protein [Nemania sp. FL0031]|nr:WD40-repeat-containing domain protein [Nemania sp. FL0031]
MSHEAATPGRLGREYVLNPITALAFLTLGDKRYLLAAEDTDIKVYDTAASCLCGTLPVFRGQPIHGISVPPAAENGIGSPRQILVWGGPIVKVLSSRIIEELICPSLENGDSEAHGSFYGEPILVDMALSAPEAIAPDWIFDGRISPFDENRIVLLTAHNEVIQGRVSSDQTTLTLGQVQSPSRPILYSGNFFWVERDCVLVAAGTVFGEIVVWKCHLASSVDKDNYENGSIEDNTRERRDAVSCEVLFVFSGHEGSIFGVHISPEIITSSGETIRLLASCSDDRTIRIWDITERRHESTNKKNSFENQISNARQTGFGDSIVGSIGVVNSPSRCVAMAMGHVSRIWQVEIRTPGPLSKGDAIQVYSFGEDATMQRWHLKLDASLETGLGVSSSSSQPPLKLMHYETFLNHNGKQIWSHAMISNENGLLIVTGGGDGKIALMEMGSNHTARDPDDITESTDLRQQSTQQLEVSPLTLIEKCQHQNAGATPSISSFKHGNGKEMFQAFTFITDNKLIITTRSGRLFLGTFDTKTEWKEITISDEIRTTIQSYTVLRSSKRASIAFIGAPSGELFYYHEASSNSLCSIYKAERKITEIICLSDTLASSLHALSDANGESGGYIELLITVYGSPRAEILRLDQNRILIQRTEIIVPDEFFVTTAAWCHGYLVLGSRHGSIAIFKRTTNGDYAILLTVDVTVGDKITSVLQFPRHSMHSPTYFLTTSRDGKYRIYEIPNTTSNFQLHLLHETRPPLGPMIEGSWLFDNQDGTQDAVLYGFRSKYFIVWNVTQQREVAMFDCGGGHRAYDQIQIVGNPEGVRFVCTKAAQMRIFSQVRAPHLPLKTGGHGREIKALSASGKLVATGAEDTVIRIWQLREWSQPRGEQKLRCVLALEKHNTGIQKLKWFKDQYLFSSGGNEEFFAWRITPLKSNICPLGVVCEAVFPDRSEDGDLRIMDFDVHCLGEYASAGHGVQNTEAISEKSRAELQFCISMSLSNSTVQSYLYSAQHGFQLLGRQTYTGACLTQLRHLNFTDRYYPQVLTAATDGHLAVFPNLRFPGDGTEDLTGILVTKLHQSSIKSLDMRSITTTTGTSYLVVTGGDDDAIGVLHLYSPSLTLSTKPPSTQHVPTDSSAATNPNLIPDEISVPVSSSSPNHAFPPSPSSQKQALPYYEIRNKFIVRSAHAAAVTGLGIVRLENEGRDAVVVTTSNDQRVKTWRLVDWQSMHPKVHLLDNRYSGVADAGDLEVIGEWYSDEDKMPLDMRNEQKKVLVAGVGIEIWGVS